MTFVPIRLRAGRKRAYKAELIARHGNRCAYCGRSGRVQRLTIDHVVPVSAGGQNVLENLMLACVKCNRKKGSQPADKFTRQAARNKTYA